MRAIAILLGFYLLIRQAEKDGLDVKKVYWTCIIAIFFAVISGRLYIILQNIQYYNNQPWEMLQFWEGGFASYGAFIGWVVAAIIAARWQELSATKFLDCCAPFMALVIVFSRVGCFLNGCCYGKISNIPWALRFPEGSGPHYAHMYDGYIVSQELSLPVHPTQLYEAMYALVIFLMLIMYRKNQKHNGELFALLFILYPLGRFLNEFLRGDDRGLITCLSLPQFFSIIMAILAFTFLVVKYKVSRGLR